MTIHPLIIDCDPGIDDALALWFAASSPREIQLLGVTCVAGNRPVATTTANTCRLLDAAAHAHVPVFEGASTPLTYPEARCNLVHGEDGLGGVAVPGNKQPEAEFAVEFLIRTLREAPLHSIHLAAIGPLTNLALAERQYPGILRRTRSLLIMGGAVHCAGNVTPHAEFNFFADPIAAQIVLNSEAHIELFPLDVTSKAIMTPEWIASLAGGQRRCMALSHQMLTAYAKLDPLLHDACPIAHLLAPRLFTGTSCAISVECGIGPHSGHVTVLDDGTPPNVRFFNEVDNDALMALVRQQLGQLP